MRASPPEEKKRGVDDTTDGGEPLLSPTDEAMLLRENAQKPDTTTWKARRVFFAREAADYQLGYE